MARSKFLNFWNGYVQQQDACRPIHSTRSSVTIVANKTARSTIGSYLQDTTFADDGTWSLNALEGATVQMFKLTYEVQGLTAQPPVTTEHHQLEPNDTPAFSSMSLGSVLRLHQLSSPAKNRCWDAEILSWIRDARSLLLLTWEIYVEPSAATYPNKGAMGK